MMRPLNAKRKELEMPDFTIPLVLIFFLFLGILAIYKLALAVWVGIEILMGKR